MDDKMDHMKELEERTSEMYKKMETPEGMREVVAGTLWGKGHAKCRSCNTVVEYDVSNPNVNVEEVTVRPDGGYLSPNPRPRQGFRFVMACPTGDGQIDFGEFYSSIGLGRGSPGDRYTPDGPARGYTSELVAAYRELGEENARQRREFGEGFLDKAWKDMQAKKA